MPLSWNDFDPPASDFEFYLYKTTNMIAFQRRRRDREARLALGPTARLRQLARGTVGDTIFMPGYRNAGQISATTAHLAIDMGCEFSTKQTDCLVTGERGLTVKLIKAAVRLREELPPRNGPSFAELEAKWLAKCAEDRAADAVREALRTERASQHSEQLNAAAKRASEMTLAELLKPLPVEPALPGAMSTKGLTLADLQAKTAPEGPKVT